MSRIKIDQALIETRDAAEAVMNDLAQTANNKRKLVARRDHEVLALNAKYEPDLAACDADLKAKTEALNAWASSHPEEFPKGRKSIEFLSGTLGFRTGTPKLALLSRGWTWEKVNEAVGKLLPNFIRNRPEVDKAAIIGQRDELGEFLPRVGVKVTQGETFFADPKLTDVD